MKTVPVVAASLLSIALSSCGEIGKNADERYDVGYSDGYAVGYNTACEIRATLIEGDWKDEDYSRGYAAGHTDGVIACNDDRKKDE